MERDSTTSRASRSKPHHRSGFAVAVVAVGIVTAIAVASAVVVTLVAMLVSAASRLPQSFDRGFLSGLTTWDSGTKLAAVAIFGVTYLVMAIGKLPGYQLDRAGAALLGASLMVGVGAISLDQAYRAIDFGTITLLLGMMIVVANLRLSGFFQLVSNWVVMRARHPLVLLIAIVLIAGAFSAFLVNDTVCLVMTPLVLDFVRRLKRDPVPYLLAIAMASNAGSTATITGNPQNMIIGGFSQIPYDAFAAALWPVAAMGMLLTALLIFLIYRREFLTTERLPELPMRPTRVHRFLVFRSVFVTAAMMVLFFAGQSVAKVAIVGGALLLFTRSIKAEKVYREIDWPLLLMFVGLFIVVAGFEASVLSPDTIRLVSGLDLDHAGALSLATAALSNLVSNVPAVLVLKPLVAASANPQHTWLIVAMASTLAGNFTLVGSVANLIVAQRAEAEGVSIGFWAYFKVGAPLTVLSVLFGIYWL